MAVWGSGQTSGMVSTRPSLGGRTTDATRESKALAKVFYHATTLGGLTAFEVGIGGAGESDAPLQCIWMYGAPEPARQFARMTLSNRRPGAALWVYQIALQENAVVGDTLSPEDLPAASAAALRSQCLPWWRHWAWRGSWPEALGIDLDRRGIRGYQARKNAMFARLRDAGIHALRNCEINWCEGKVRHYRDDYGATTTVLLDPAVAEITGRERL